MSQPGAAAIPSQIFPQEAVWPLTDMLLANSQLNIAPSLYQSSQYTDYVAAGDNAYRNLSAALKNFHEYGVIVTYPAATGQGETLTVMGPQPNARLAGLLKTAWRIDKHMSEVSNGMTNHLRYVVRAARSIAEAHVKAAVVYDNPSVCSNYLGEIAHAHLSQWIARDALPRTEPRHATDRDGNIQMIDGQPAIIAPEITDPKIIGFLHEMRKSKDL